MPEENQTSESETNTENQGPNLSLLASNMFGSQYTGEVQKEEPAAPESDSSEEEPGEEKEVSEEAEETDSEEQPEADSEEEEPGEEEDGEKTISSVDELVNHYELDPEWFEGLELPVKVDGEAKKVKLSDLKKSFQMTEAAEKRLEDAKSRAKTQNQELAQKQEGLNQQYQTAASLIQEAESLFTEDEKAIDWQNLRERDPAEYSAKKAEMSERKQRIEQMKEKAVQQYQQTSQQSQEQLQQQKQELLQEEHQKLLERIPEWEDSEKAQKEKSQVAKYLMDQGLTQQEVENATDHRLIDLARKAMLYEQSKPKQETARKKVAKVPKTMKSGKAKTQTQIDQERLNKQREKLKKSGSLNDAYELLKASRGN